MLTIRKPLELKIQSPMLGLRQDMADRMQANYGLMNMPIRKEELLHVTSETPEIYFAEGDSLAIFNNIKSENQQEIRLDVINNLMNRILVSQTENFTYQDTVYISSVLRKLGIRDEKTFMKQVFALQNEHKETKNLLKSYENNQKILEEFFIEQNKLQASESKKEESISKRKQRYYIHNDIFKRLETGKIYQDIRLFSKGNRHESQQIYRTELNIGEQATVEQNFLLQTLKQKVSKQEAPLYYAHNNQYEYLQEISENIEESLEEQMSAAILLNLVDQSYALRQQQIEENSHYWYSIAGALFQTAENTWKRYEANLLERKFVSTDVTQVIDYVSQVKHLENNTILNIADAYTKLETQIANYAQTNHSVLQNQPQINNVEDVTVSGGYYHLTEEELNLQFLNQNEEIENETTAITVEQLQEQLNIFNQKNYENYLKLEEIAKSKPQIKERKLDRKKAQKDALRALENPAEVLNEYLTTEKTDAITESNKIFESQIYNLFSDETKEIYRQFLKQNRTTEETFLQSIMNQSEDRDIQKELTKIVEHTKTEVPDHVYQEIKAYAEYMQSFPDNSTNAEIYQKITDGNTTQNVDVSNQWVISEENKLILPVEKETLLEETLSLQERFLEQRNEFVQKDTSSVLSKEVEKVFENQQFVHPEQFIEVEEYQNNNTKQTLLEHFQNLEEGEHAKDFLHISQYNDSLNVLQQVRTKIKDIYQQFLLHNHPIEKSIISPNLNHLDEAETQKEIVKIVEQVRKEYPDQVYQEIKAYAEYMQALTVQVTNNTLHQQMLDVNDLQNTNIHEQWLSAEETKILSQVEKEKLLQERIALQEKILEQRKDLVQSNNTMIVSKEVENVYENQQLIHPEQLIEVEEQYPKESQEKLLEHIKERKEKNVTKELSHTTHYVENIETIQELDTKLKESMVENKPIIYETINEELKHQMQVFKNLQNINVYEKWTMPADVVWKIEQTEAQLNEEQVLQQQEILKKTKENTIIDTKIEVLEEVNRQLEKQTILHPESIIETEEVFQEMNQKEILHVQETMFIDLQQNVEKQLKLQQTEQQLHFNQTHKDQIFRNIDFVHKVEEQIFNEELLEEIRMQKQNVRREEHTEQTTFENKKMVNQIVQESTHHIQTNQLNQIEELVQQSVKKQIGDLSDQVYGKIEKKLQTERKRRGYF